MTKEQVIISTFAKEIYEMFSNRESIQEFITDCEHIALMEALISEITAVDLFDYKNAILDGFCLLGAYEHAEKNHTELKEFHDERQIMKPIITIVEEAAHALKTGSRYDFITNPHYLDTLTKEYYGTEANDEVLMTISAFAYFVVKYLYGGKK